MSLLLSVGPLVAFASLTDMVAVEAGLWAGVALCAALIVRGRRSGGQFITMSAAGTAVLLGSVALVAP